MCMCTRCKLLSLLNTDKCCQDHSASLATVSSSIFIDRVIELVVIDFLVIIGLPFILSRLPLEFTIVVEI